MSKNTENPEATTVGNVGQLDADVTPGPPTGDELVPEFPNVARPAWAEKHDPDVVDLDGYVTRTWVRVVIDEPFFKAQVTRLDTLVDGRVDEGQLELDVSIGRDAPITFIDPEHAWDAGRLLRRASLSYAQVFDSPSREKQ
jgi:hypothetical protein